MKSSSKISYGSPSSSKEFLFCQTDAGVCPENVQKPRPVGIKELGREFPDLLIGKAFIDNAVARLDSSLEFGVMLIRIDNFSRIEEKSGVTYAVKVLTDTARAVYNVCRQNPFIWGLIERDMYGCFFPENNESQCRPFARKIVEEMAKWCKETLSIGIAIYPALQFTRIQTIRNARKALDHAGFFGPGSIIAFNAESLNISGDKFYQQGNINAAIAEFKKAILMDPSNMNVHNSLGVCYSVLKAFKSAIKEFETAAQLAPDEVMPLYNTGLVYMQMEKYEKALEFFFKADKTGQSGFEVAFQTARLYFKIKDFNKAEEFFHKALRIKPDSATALRCLAECLVSMNNFSEAVNVYRKAVKVNPNDAAALSALGHLYDLMGENPEIAAALCKHSIEIAPDNGLFHHRLARLYLKQNLYDDALEEFEHAAKLGCDSSQYIKDIKDIMSRD
ncbi:Putative diguanylate cyclase, tetratricopeptide domain-containing [Desulfonema limicola]|uniref:Diguanylate cyclase, tetratricopeptide domain-containing n=1 Tax=Desulfonema limicola TaxID=45656 RepID=A0A975B3S5_9BACT|nr:tetratricopeptide repeat protein [Desulfonema limicola]QTA78260.1 Putative diguanylate cyclase, tetratricopeptide domain-containing [Desulfonema limicola]